MFGGLASSMRLFTRSWGSVVLSFRLSILTIVPTSSGRLLNGLLPFHQRGI